CLVPRSWTVPGFFVLCAKSAKRGTRHQEPMHLRRARSCLVLGASFLDVPGFFVLCAKAAKRGTRHQEPMHLRRARSCLVLGASFLDGAWFLRALCEGCET